MSTISLIKNCKLTKERNARVFPTFLRYLASIVANEPDNIVRIQNCQYQQIALKKTIKLDLAESQVGKAVYNYLTIEQDSKTYGYFIDKANWKSTSTVEFEVTMDTVNTYAWQFNFSEKTHIVRQHKDRLELKDAAVQVYDPDELFPEGYPKTNADLLLNPWAYENEVYDTFYIRWSFGDLESCTITKYQDGRELLSYDNVIRIEQDYVGQSGVAMTFRYYNTTTSQDVDVVLEYADLISDFNNGIYWVIKFVGNVSDLTYDSNDAWTSLFYGFYQHRLIRLVDKYPEGINPPLFKNPEEYQIEDNNSNTSWYLVYKTTTADDNSSIQCQLWPRETTSIKLRGSMTKSPTDFVAGTYYYIMPKSAAHGNISHDNRNFEYGNETVGKNFINLVRTADNSNVGRVRNEPADYHNNEGAYWCILYRDGNDLKIEEWMNKDNFWAQIENKLVNTYTIPQGGTFKFTDYLGSSVNYYTFGSKVTNITTLWTNAKNGLMNHSAFTVTSTSQTLKSFDELDRTDSRLVKVIALPYSFVNINSNGLFSSDAWQYDANGFLYLNNLNNKFTSQLDVAYNPLEPLMIIDNVEDGIDRDDKYESKLYNSEFYMPKFIYDSFNYGYQLENISSPSMIDYEHNIIDYQVANTINSRFLFGFNIPLDRSTSDYDKICLVSRNNEMPIYNNSYLNYIRSGYNYDVKNKNIILKNSIASTGISTVQSAAQGAIKGGVWGAVAAGGTALVTNLVGVIANQEQADLSIKQKLDEASRQATSVSETDDIDLLDTYTNGNKAKYAVYQCSDRLRSSLADFFYYCGYADDVYEAPNIHTRKYFNFLQCEPVFNEVDTSSVYQEYLDDMREKYKQGVTIYHEYARFKWDWDQEKENWELSLLD